MLSSGEIHLEAQDSKSADMRNSTGDAQSLKQGGKINMCTLSLLLGA